MKFTGRLKEPIIDYLTGRLTILFEPCEDFRQTYEELKGCEKLSLEIKKYRRKRSLDANAYYWVLIGKLAKVLELSNPETHNMMLCRYGQPEIFEDKAVYMTIPDTEAAERRSRMQQIITFSLLHRYAREMTESCTGLTSSCEDHTHTTVRKWHG